MLKCLNSYLKRLLWLKRKWGFYPRRDCNWEWYSIQHLRQTLLRIPNRTGNRKIENVTDRWEVKAIDENVALISKKKKEESPK